MKIKIVNKYMLIIMSIISFNFTACGNSEEDLTKATYYDMTNNYTMCRNSKLSVCSNPKNIAYGNEAIMLHSEMAKKSRAYGEPKTDMGWKLSDFAADFNSKYFNSDLPGRHQVALIADDKIHLVIKFDQPLGKNPVFVEYEDYTIFITDFGDDYTSIYRAIYWADISNNIKRIKEWYTYKLW